MPTPSSSPFLANAARFGAALSQLFEELDWELLGREYCHEGGEHFFAPADVEQLLDAELQFAAAIGELLQRHPGGHSVYVGAALAELGPILAEAILLGRSVTWVNRPCAEVTELNRALSVSGLEPGTLSAIETSPAALERVPPRSADHLWMVSVLNDPEAFPALHDELYGRGGTELSAGPGHLEEERARAAELVRSCVAKVREGGFVTVTTEELPLFAEAAQRDGRSLTATSPARLSPIVGDPVQTFVLGGASSA